MTSPPEPRWSYGEGFISQDTYRDVMAALRSDHRGFSTDARAFAAIREVCADKTLNTSAQMTVIRRIVREHAHSTEQ